MKKDWPMIIITLQSSLSWHTEIIFHHTKMLVQTTIIFLPFEMIGFLFIWRTRDIDILLGGEGEVRTFGRSTPGQRNTVVRTELLSRNHSFSSVCHWVTKSDYIFVMLRNISWGNLDLCFFIKGKPLKCHIGMMILFRGYFKLAELFSERGKWEWGRTGRMCT